MGTKSEKTTFPGHDGSLLAARLDRPDTGPIRAYALFAHCFTCGKDIFAAGRIAKALTGHGIAVLRFDFTGLGMSEGEFANTHFTSNVDDLVAAADYLRSQEAAPALLIGHSLGGAAVLAAAARIPEAQGVATIGAPADPGHVVHNFEAHLDQIERDGQAEVKLGGRAFTIRNSFLQDVAAARLDEAVAGLRRALLVFHSPIDNIVGIDNAARIYGAAKHPKSFVSLDDADHLLSRASDAAYVADTLAAWASRYLPEGPVVAEQTQDPVPAQAQTQSGTNAGPISPGAVAADTPEAGWTWVAENGQARLSQTVRTGAHQFSADEPVDVPGGADTGPSPYDLLSAALGACTSMTVRMVADRKGWPLDRVAVGVHHGKIHAKDCADCETKVGRIDRFERQLVLSGALSAEQRATLLDIADRCPVHRTLHSEVIVTT
ncbi:MAG: alpha/beta fold hydrolase, partial [Rhodospirillaceae bacterium]